MSIENTTQHKYLGKLFCLTVSVFASLGFWQLMKTSVPASVSSGKNPYWIIYILFILIYLWLTYYFREGKQFSVSAGIIAVLLTFWGISGFFLEGSNMQTFFFTGDPLAAGALFFGQAVLAYTFISALYKELDGLGFHDRTGLSDRTTFWGCFCVIMTCWLPFIIMNYPGSVARDTLHQLIQFSGRFPFVASFPLFDTFIYGILFNCGQQLLNDNLGVFLNVAFQTLLCGIAMARACKWIYKFSCSAKMCIITASFFAIIPLWGAAVQCLLKDVLHLGFFLLFFVTYIKILYLEENKTRDYVALSVHALLAGLSRKAAIAIILISLICLAMYEIKRRKNIRTVIMPAILVGIVYFLIHSLILLSPNVIPPAERENYSLPFQMVARYCQQYGNELSQDQIEVIDAVLDYDVIRTEYTPELSDAVKNTFHASTDQMAEFWRLFLKLGLKHPEVYFEQLLLGTYKYFYPLSPGANGFRFYIADKVSKVSDFYEAHTVNVSSQKLITYYCKQWERTLGLELFIGPGLYTWIVVLIIGYALRYRSLRSIIAMAPIIILMIGLLFTPVNGENRYAYPLMAAAPICLSIVVSQINISKEKDASAELLNHAKQ